MSAVATMGTGLPSGCRKLGTHRALARWGDIPGRVLREPSRSQEADRLAAPPAPARQPELVEQVGLS
jgi:hypothetical protein